MRASTYLQIGSVASPQTPHPARYARHLPKGPKGEAKKCRNLSALPKEERREM